MYYLKYLICQDFTVILYQSSVYNLDRTHSFIYQRESRSSRHIGLDVIANYRSSIHRSIQRREVRLIAKVHHYLHSLNVKCNSVNYGCLRNHNNLTNYVYINQKAVWMIKLK